ncbi:MAG: hypothetical protein RL701_5991 [Pseudomonadota bacterium]|jgi:hypothetical protein
MMQKSVFSTIENVAAIAALVWLANQKAITGQWAAILICVVIGVISAQQIVAFLRGQTSSTTTTVTTDIPSKPQGPGPSAGIISLLIANPMIKLAATALGLVSTTGKII